MTEPEIVTRPRPSENGAVAPGSPAAIEIAGVELMAQIRAGSVDADSFAANAMLALTAMGVELDPSWAPMLAGMLASGYTE